MIDQTTATQLVAGVTSLIAVWRTAVSFTATRDRNRMQREQLAQRQRESDAENERKIEERENAFASKLRDELRDDITRLKTDVRGLEEDNHNLRLELGRVTRENLDMQRQVVGLEQRVVLQDARIVQLEGVLQANNIAVPPHPYGAWGRPVEPPK